MTTDDSSHYEVDKVTDSTPQSNLETVATPSSNDETLAYGSGISGGTLAAEPGTVIGRYTLVQKLGEGGFGVVFRATQEQPYRRTVALKIIKLGMDTRQVIRRFEAERQALALMNHPCIAKVLDAGSTESGRPYFVMELVKGVKITSYCDQQRLSIEERLKQCGTRADFYGPCGPFVPTQMTCAQVEPQLNSPPLD